MNLLHQFRVFTWAAMHSPNFSTDCQVQLPVMVEVWATRSHHCIYLHAEVILRPLEFDVPYHVEAKFYQWESDRRTRPVKNNTRVIQGDSDETINAATH